MQPITILRSAGIALAKTWLADGSIDDYGRAKNFTWYQSHVDTIDDLHRALLELQGCQNDCIIRGQPGEAAAVAKRAGKRIERNLDNFVDDPSTLFMVDVDKFALNVDEAGVLEDPQAALQRFVDQRMPEPFHDVSYVWQLSSGMGHPTKAAQLRAHLWFLLEEPLTCEQAEAWAKQYVPAADHTVHRRVQVNYTAAPLTVDGGPVDPYAGKRVGLARGVLGDVVSIPPSMPVPTIEAVRVRRAARATGMVDPRSKPGVIGALCRAFEPHAIVDLFPEHFEAGSKPERITWLHGGGTPEGIYVTDDALHLGNTHATAPTDRALNLFDFIRLHVFGELDGDGDYDLDPTAAPAYQATLKWAREQPAVLEEMQETVDQAHARLDAKAEAQAAASEASAEADQAKDESLQQRIASAATTRQLQALVANWKTDRSISQTDRDRVALQLQQATRRTEGGRGLPMKTVRSWVTPETVDVAELRRAVFPDVGPDGQVLGTIGNLEALCRSLGATVRYDMIRKRQDVLAAGKPGYIDEQADNATFAWVTSEAAKVGMPHQANQLKLYLTELAARNPYNPVLEWIESEPWDGRSRIDELLKTITLRKGFEPGLAKMILRKWLIQAVAMAATDAPLQSRGVLVLSGPQYVGKTRWFKSLVRGHENLAILGRQIDPHNKDDVKIAISHWICELGEIDGTFKRDVAAIKAFLANVEDTFRLPYAPAESKFQRRTVFTASVNGDEFLVDDTGNTRFWVLIVEAMNHEHDIDMQQLWAEMLHAWREGEQHWFAANEMAQVNAHNEQFVVREPIAEAVITRFQFDDAKLEPENYVWVWRTPTEIANLCGYSKPTRGDLQSLGRVMTKITGEDSKSDGLVRRRRVPLLRTEVEFDELPEAA
jgi:putative DNA primase/helicase